MLKSLGASIEHVSYFVPHCLVDGDTKLLVREKTAKDAWFLAPKSKRYAYPDYTAVDLGTNAVNKLLREIHVAPEGIDLLLFSCALNDRVKVPIGGDVRFNAGLKSARIMQIDTGCTSYLSLLKVADGFLASGQYKNAILLTVTDFISRLKDFQSNPKSAVLGDGASATLVKRGTSSILSSYEKVRGENFGLMICGPKKIDKIRRPFNVVSPAPLQIEFSRRMLKKLRDDSIACVGEAVNAAMSQASISKEDVDFFLCHQPNMGLMEQWRKDLGFLSNQVYDTFELFGNLFQSSIPVSLAHGMAHNTIAKGSTIACGTFSNGADFTCAMVLRI